MAYSRDISGRVAGRQTISCSRIIIRASYGYPLSYPTCVYRKLKPGRNDGEARRGSGVNE